LNAAAAGGLIGVVIAAVTVAVLARRRGQSARGT
jgi:gas vesicle protein